VITISSRAFNQDASKAKRAAAAGPVIITDRGRPSHVLMSIEEYRRLTGQRVSIATLLGDASDVPFDSPRLGAASRAADLG
jgi:prevent-host-death family protein